MSRPDAATGTGPGSPPATPVGLQDHALIALAVAGVRARVIVNGEQEAKLAGYRSAKDDLELHVDPDPTGDGWYPPSALRLVQTTFS